MTIEQEYTKFILNKINDIKLEQMYDKGMFGKELLIKPKFRFDINVTIDLQEITGGNCVIGIIPKTRICQTKPYIIKKEQRGEK